MDDSVQLLALLSMDSYNRGYNSGVSSTPNDGLGTNPELESESGEPLIYSKIGSVEILTRDEFGIAGGKYAEWQAISFYAQAYRLTEDVGDLSAGTIVISFRGTDDPIPDDAWEGWLQGAGATPSQTHAAAQFYDAVKRKFELDAGDSPVPEIVLTGHSLGGGLAGFLAAGHGLRAWIFDNMPFEAAIESILGLSEERLVEEATLMTDAALQVGRYVGIEYRESQEWLDLYAHNLSTLRGNNEERQIAVSLERDRLIEQATREADAFFGVGVDTAEDFRETAVWIEYFDEILRELESTALYLSPRAPDMSGINAYAVPGEFLEYIRGGQRTHVESVGGESFPLFDAINPAHSMTTLILVAAVSDHLGAQSLQFSSWEAADRGELMRAFFDDANGSAAGFPETNVSGTAGPGGKLATAISYSLFQDLEIQEFGNAAGRALLNGVSSLAMLRAFSDVGDSVWAWANNLVVRFSGKLANERIDASQINANRLLGPISVLPGASSGENYALIDASVDFWRTESHDWSSATQGFWTAGAHLGHTFLNFFDFSISDDLSHDDLSHFSEVEWGREIGLNFSGFIGANLDRAVLAVADSINMNLGERSEEASRMSKDDGVSVFLGGSLENSIAGSDGWDIIAGGSSNDVIRAYAGSDVIAGGKGQDQIDAGAGNDLIFGDGGQDDHEGDADIITGGAGNDRIYAGEGNDVIIEGAGDDLISGGDGIDTVTYEEIAEEHFVEDTSQFSHDWGRYGVDPHGWGIYVEGAYVSHAVDGTIYRDTLVDVEKIVGTSKRDYFDGLRAGIGEFDGGRGADYVVVREYSFTVHGGEDDAATDVIESASDWDDVRFDISREEDGSEVATLSYGGVLGFWDWTGQAFGFERILGGSGDDIFAFRDATSLEIDGGAGTNRLEIRLNDGEQNTNENEGIRFEDGTLTFVSNGAHAALVNIQDLRSAGGNDVIHVGDLERVESEGGNDTVFSSLGYAWIDGGDGVDALSYENVDESLYINLFNAEVFRLSDMESWWSGLWAPREIVKNFEDVTGGTAADHIIGSELAETIRGHRGDDTIEAGGGDDTIVEGAGNDAIHGGSGTDTVTYRDIAEGHLIAESLHFTDHDWARYGIDAQHAWGIYLQGQFVSHAVDGVIHRDTLTGIERIVGTDQRDFFDGMDEGIRTVHGGKGADHVVARAGSFAAYGGEEDATRDLLEVATDQNGIVIEISSFEDGSERIDATYDSWINDWSGQGIGFESLLAGSGDDTIIFRKAMSVDIDGGNGGNTLIIDLAPEEDASGSSGIDFIDGVMTFRQNGASMDVKRISELHATVGNDTIDVTGLTAVYGSGGSDTFISAGGAGTTIHAGEDPVGENPDAEPEMDTLVLVNAPQTNGYRVSMVDGVELIQFFNQSTFSVLGHATGIERLIGDERVTLVELRSMMSFKFDGGEGVDRLNVMTSPMWSVVPEESLTFINGRITFVNSGDVVEITSVERFTSGKGHDLIETSGMISVDASGGDDLVIVKDVASPIDLGLLPGSAIQILGGSGNDTLSYAEIDNTLHPLIPSYNWTRFEKSPHEWGVWFAGGTARHSEDQGGRTVQIGGFETILGSKYADYIDFSGSNHGVFHGGGGADHVVNRTSAFTHFGGEGDDAIDILEIRTTLNDTVFSVSRRLDGTEEIEARFSGTTPWVGTGHGFEYVAGGVANDVFVFRDAAGVTVDGGGGSNRVELQLGLGYTVGEMEAVRYEDNLLSFLASSEVARLKSIQTLRTGAGDDIIHADGLARAEGMGGNDQFFQTGGQATFFDGGVGTNTLSYEGLATTFLNTSNNLLYGIFRTATGLQHGNGTTSYTDGYTAIQRLILSPFDDYIVNVATAEIHGRAGNDRIEGQAGNDVFFGDAGADILIGHGGNDTLWGGDDNDRLWGGAGNDVLVGGAGDDVLYGEVGSDIFMGGAGRDTYVGASDSWDMISFQDVPKTANGSGGVEVHGHSNTIVNDGFGNQETMSFMRQIIGSENNDILYSMRWTTNNTALSGKGGDDYLYLRGYRGEAYGEEGNDYISARSADNTSKNTMYGGNGNDTILNRGFASDNWMYGEAGNDRLWGDAGGEDLLSGGQGSDLVVTGGSLHNQDQMYGGTQADIFGFISGSAFGTFGTAWVHDFNPMEDILLFNSAFQARWNAAPKFQEGAHLRVAISKDESVVIYNTTLSALQDRIEWSDNFDAFYAQWVSTHSAPPEVPVA